VVCSISKSVLAVDEIKMIWMLFDHLAHAFSSMRLTLRLAAAGWATVACAWCAAVCAVGVLGEGLEALVALGVLGVSAFAALFAWRRRVVR
jgi:hypothetical protein